VTYPASLNHVGYFASQLQLSPLTQLPSTPQLHLWALESFPVIRIHTICLRFASESFEIGVSSSHFRLEFVINVWSSFLVTNELQNTQQCELCGVLVVFYNMQIVSYISVESSKFGTMALESVYSHVPQLKGHSGQH
jgi:hypothetical protein